MAESTMRQSRLKDVLPLAPMQEGLLFHALYDDEAVDLYAVQFSLRLNGPVDAQALRAAVEAVLRRHPNLSAGFRLTQQGRAVQVVPRHLELPWEEADLTGVPAPDREAALTRMLSADRELRFDLARPPLVRCTLARTGETRRTLILTMHHILVDGWSMPLLIADLFALYENGGDERALPPAPPYRDFLTWLAAQDRETAEAAWRETLAGLPGPTLFAPRASGARSVTPGRVIAEVPVALGSALTALARRSDLTVNTLFQGAWGLLLGRLTGRQDVVFGATAAGRPPEVAGVENMVGLFVNTLPVRVRYGAAESALAALTRLQQRQSVLLDHQHVALADIQRQTGLGELFDTLVAFESYPSDPDAFRTAVGDVEIESIETHDATHYPLALIVVPGERMRLRLDYQQHCLDRRSAEQLVERLIRLLQAIADDPYQPVGRISLLSRQERDALVAEQNRLPRTPALHELVEAEAAHTPDATALRGDDGQELTLGQLNARANQLARVLIGRGIGAEDMVALALMPSAAFTTAVLAVLKTGAAYTVLDTGRSPERAAELIAAARPALALVESAGSPAGPLGQVIVIDAPDTLAESRAQPEGDLRPGERVRPVLPSHAACLSRRSGTDEDVVVPHGALADLVLPGPGGDHAPGGVLPGPGALASVADILHTAGPAFARLRTLVLDHALEPVPIGAVGEVYLVGGLPRAYPGHADRTAEGLVANPYGPVGSRMLRTGSLARRTSSGTLVLVERSDTPRGADRLPDVPHTAPRRRPARTPQEELLCGLFAEVLGRPAIGIDDDFFELGGHSLMATRLISRVRSTLGVEVDVRALFEAPTVAALGQVLTRTDVARSAPSAVDRPDRVPLSYAQRRLWFLGHFEGVGAALNIPLALRVTGTLDTTALRDALGDVMARHESLRTVFPQDADGPYQAVLSSEDAWPELPVTDVREAELAPALAAASQHVFDLATEPPLRASVLRAGPHESVILLLMHHIAGDGWSLGPLARDLADAYTARREGHKPHWQPLPVQYADYTLWQRETLGEETDRQSPHARQLAYWTEALAGLPARIDLPADRPRPEVPSFGADAVPLNIDPDLHQRLADLSKANRASLFMVVQAGLAALLTRMGAGTDIPLGSPIAGRTDDALDDLVGLFVNTLVLRNDTSGDPGFRELLRRVRATDLAAYAHQDLPFERLVEALNPVRSTSHQPLFQVMLALQNTTEPDFRLPEAQARPEPVDMPVSQFELSVILNERRDDHGRPAGLQGWIQYSSDLFERETVESLAARLVRLLTAAANEPDLSITRIDILGPAERRRLLTEWNHTGTAATPASLHALFERQAARRPAAPALVSADDALSYAEVNAAANRMGRALRARGIGPEHIVALALPRSTDLVLAALAVLKTGAAYLPVDPAYPDDRVALMLADSAPACLITDSTRDTGRPAAVLAHPQLLDLPELRREAAAYPGADLADHERTAPTDVRHPAYVIYTSGSTGRPKGVLVTHLGIADFAAAEVEAFAVGPDSRVLQMASPSFDASVLEMCVTFAAGAALVVAPAGPQGGRELADLLQEQAVTHAFISPAALAGMPECALPRLATLVVGGEACPPALVARWSQGRRMINAYGPTESTVAATLSAPLSGDGTVPIGRPLPGTRVYVLDDALRLLPPGVVGELYIAGAGLARGYLHRTALTAVRFVADPHGPRGARMYRTGDRARWTPDGHLEFAGRADGQLKLRGIRIEPGEIEAVLAQDPRVAQAVVVAREDAPGDRRLAAYIVPRTPAERPDPAELRARAARTLPAFMVPSAYAVLDALPLTGSGKPDREALPVPEPVDALPGRGARTPQEQILCGLFSEVLGRAQVGVDDDFFALGGHSLLATRLTARIRAVLGVDLPVRALFDAPTVAGLVHHLDGADEASPALGSVARPATLPLSFAQRRMWLLHRIEGPSPTYNIPLVLRLSGTLDRAALHQALGDLMERHESLRTIFPEQAGVPCQRILDAAEAHQEPSPVDTVEENLPELLAEAVRHRFDLTAEPPVRTWLYALGGEQHVLVLLIHHIAGDGSSLAPLARDLAEAYRARAAGEVPGWGALLVQYADYTLWQNELLGDEADPDSRAHRQLEFWRHTLADLPESLHLPADRSRPAAASYLGDALDLHIDPGLHTELTRLAQENGTSLFMVLQASLAVLLTRLGAGTDIPIGSPIAGRTDEALDDLVGFFVNTLVLRTDTSGNPSFRELLGRVRETDLAAYGHQDLPFERLVEALNPTRSLSHQPLIQVVLALQNMTEPAFTLPGLHARMEPMGTKSAKFDLSFYFRERRAADGTSEGIHGFVEYATELFDRASVEGLAGRLRRVLTAVVADPDLPVGRLDLLAPGERQDLLALGGGAATPLPDTGLAALFEAQVERTPAAVAVVADGETTRTTLSYSELDERADRLAHRLVAAGVRAESCVALLVDRSPDLVVAVVAVAKVGGVYVPLHADWPTERRKAAVAETGARVVLADRPGRATGCGAEVTEMVIGAGSGDEPRSTLRRPVHPDSLAYVMYTSGSTGAPKGVAVTQRDVVSLVLDSGWDGVTAPRTLVYAPHSFDASTAELWVPLLSGGRLVVAPEGELDVDALSELITAESVERLWLTAGLFHLMAEQRPDAFSGVPEVWAGGDVLSADAVRAVMTACPGTVVVNGYGPTETTTFATRHTMGPERMPTASVPIGRALDNHQVRVLDDGLQPVPRGATGELYVAGAGLARGYWGLPGATAERFVADPYGPPGTRLYRTGDLVRWGAGDALEFIGRADDQAKIRGFRIEPGEVESVLRRHPAVAQAAVVVREDHPGDKRLAAYLVPADTSTGDGGVEADDQVDEWRSLYDTLYENTADIAFGENFSGWNSSYTGGPIPHEEMAEWRDATVAEILALRPRRVLEIGVGTGLLLSRIAPHCEAYWGTDFSAPVIAALEQQLRQQPEGYDGVTLHHRAADDLDGLPTGWFDTVVLNSVVQYFPNVDYLTGVLRGLVDLLAPGGTVFVGDVRNLRLVRTFHTAVNLHAARGGEDPAQTRRAIEQSVLMEKELLLDPDYFPAVRREIDGISGVAVRLKRGRAGNELNGYRYDAILRRRGADGLDGGTAEAPARWPELRWGLDVDSLEQATEELSVTDTGRLRITGVPNGRIAHEVWAMREFERGGDPVSVLRAAADGDFGPQPEDFHLLGERLGHRVRITWSGGSAEGDMDVLFTVDGADELPPDLGLYQDRHHTEVSACANSPARSAEVGALVTEVRATAQDALPDYMVPSAFVVLDRLPLTVNGKLDRRALPVPDLGGAAGGRQPRSAREQVLCELFAEVLGVPQVTLDDDFFALGGHSLLATRLVSRIRVVLGVELAIRNLFESPTAALLAERLDQGANTDAFNALLPLRSTGSRAPLFCVHPAGGLSWCYSGLVAQLGKDRPIYGLQSPRLSHVSSIPDTLEESAAEYVKRIREVQPSGPYHLLGWSFGGLLAYAMATELQQHGQDVALLSLLDVFPVQDEAVYEFPEDQILPALFQVVSRELARVNGQALQGDLLMETIRREGGVLGELREFHLEAVREICLRSVRQLRAFKPAVFHGDMQFFTAVEGRTENSADHTAWRSLVDGKVENHDIHCDHGSMTQPGPIKEIGRIVAAKLRSLK
ncbi:amino acid adenylation domain-containing protein [Streptomyces sp. NPDC102274]|uniref:amino acid adenylation domain-containing protein n=1 Tax=Streptomyces sp. NPDC102274 TaxID=3366151 RepID=UPI00382489FE